MCVCVLVFGRRGVNWCWRYNPFLLSQIQELYSFCRKDLFNSADGLEVILIMYNTWHYETLWVTGKKHTRERRWSSMITHKGVLKYAVWSLVETDVPVGTIESLQQSKVYQKEQRRQFKELKELVRRHQKKTSELLREFNNKYKKMARQCSKSRYTHIMW